MSKIESILDKGREKTAVDFEGENFDDFIAEALLKKKGGYKINRMIKSGKLNLNLEKNRIIVAGNAALRVNPDLNATDHFVKRCDELADNLIKKNA